jgi:membrane fusion protein, hemolysin D
MAEPAKSTNAVVAFPDKRASRRGHELAFLPAALEIVETPPSPIGRAIGATIIAVFVLALAWACLGSVDIVATAPGKIIPSGRVKVIQPFEIGVVRAIEVHDGDTVKQGQVLVELDPTINKAEWDHLKSDLVAAQLDVARLKAALAGGADPLADFHPPADASPALVASERQYLVSQVSEHHAKIAALGRQLTQKEAERATAAATIAKIEALVPLLQAQVDVRKTLYEHETGSRLVYLQTLQLLVEQQQELAVQKSKLNEAEAAVAAISETRAQAEDEYRRMLFDDLGKVEPKAAGLAQDVIRAEERTRLQQLKAPVDGVVQQLAVHTVGGVVTPAQPLMVVVPVDSHLEIEAMVSNRDIGFVEPGQDAEIKVATFNFTRYGLLHGKVLSVSHDAVGKDDPADPAKDKGRQAGEAAAKPAADDQGPVYAARISLDRTQMQIEDKLVSLSPGMAVTAEIKTGERRIISYLLSPLRKYRQDSLRER